MKVLVANLILFTSETKQIKKVESIKDTMIYNLCLAFKNEGHEVTLAASDLYKPTKDEDYPFEVAWLKTKYTSIFPANLLPCCPDIKKLVKNGNYDLIISSEVFSLCSLFIAQTKAKNLIIWQELAMHNNAYNGMASKIWYGVISPKAFKNSVVVPRSEQAKQFISKYVKNVSAEIIDHGINSDIFKPNTKKENQFSISSQLINRKQIDKSINAFANYLKKYDNTAKLYIMGEGDQKENLQSLAKQLGVEDNVIFTGKLPHHEMVKILSKAKAMLVYTARDLNMVSIVESLALATPVITTSVPFSSTFIKSENLGIVNNKWNEDDLYEISSKNIEYVNNCLEYSKTTPFEYKVKQFVDVYNKYLNKE